MENSKIIVKIVGIAQYGTTLSTAIMNAFSGTHSDSTVITCEEVDRTADMESITHELSSCDAVLLLADASQDFALLQEVASSLSASRTLTFVGIANHAAAQRDALASVADCVVEIPEGNGEEVLFHFIEGISLYYNGLFGIDWQDITTTFESAEKARIFEYPFDKADGIAQEIHLHLSNEPQIRTAKAAFVYLRFSSVFDLTTEQLDGILDSIAQNLHPDTFVWVNCVSKNFERSCVTITFTGI